MDEIQAVARAICKAHKLDCDLPEDMADYETDNEWFDWTDVALAAIAALDAARGDPVAQVVEWLRKREGVFKRRDNALADAIERGEPFNG